MVGININKFRWEAFYQANPVILDLKLGHPVEREDGHGDHPIAAGHPRLTFWQAPMQLATAMRPPRPALHPSLTMSYIVRPDLPFTHMTLPYVTFTWEVI